MLSDFKKAERLKIDNGKAFLLHFKLDCFHWIRKIQGVVFRLIGFHPYPYLITGFSNKSCFEFKTYYNWFNIKLKLL